MPPNPSVPAIAWSLPATFIVFCHGHLVGIPGRDIACQRSRLGPRVFRNNLTGPSHVLDLLIFRFILHVTVDVTLQYFDRQSGESWVSNFPNFPATPWGNMQPHLPARIATTWVLAAGRHLGNLMHDVPNNRLDDMKYDDLPKLVVAGGGGDSDDDNHNNLEITHTGASSRSPFIQCRGYVPIPHSTVLVPRHMGVDRFLIVLSHTSVLRQRHKSRRKTWELVPCPLTIHHPVQRTPDGHVVKNPHQSFAPTVDSPKTTVRVTFNLAQIPKIAKTIQPFAQEPAPSLVSGKPAHKMTAENMDVVPHTSTDTPQIQPAARGMVGWWDDGFDMWLSYQNVISMLGQRGLNSVVSDEEPVEAFVVHTRA
ncbi:hypothetical protein SODALDRAFT_357825 [Sodiomyces alkalinus F11]|uniref:Uncharacterized protein n=1 Tax=Sodiomyces alkalinus (strain CBS 110278 / VKM F-3762 / F11) TaxID=1314773 RepID=A0A3N2Q4R1_SODAK|nr:hypothetical protein SODALDRAFT_357825 [Sodiomyces alkalinus F11]ROT41742.1 hypothetical protein SODALDRAFT_357825 [Sodiomyces alkalinus F11]